MADVEHELGAIRCIVVSLTLNIKNLNYKRIWSEIH